MDKRNLILPIVLAALAATAFALWISSRKREPQKPTTVIPDTLIVGTSADYKPLSFLNENDEIVGFDIDVVREVAFRMNKEIEIKDIPFTSLVAALQLGTVHLAAAGMSSDPEREKQVLFTRSHLTGSFVIITRTQDPPLNNLEDLANKTVIINTGNLTEKLMTGQPGVTLIPLPRVSDAFLSLKAGNADAFVSSRLATNEFFRERGTDTFRMVPLEKSQEYIALGISKKYPELLPLVQEALDSMERDGTLQRLKKKWKLS